MKRHFSLACLLLGFALLIPVTPILKTSARSAISGFATRSNQSSPTIPETVAATFTVTTAADLGAGSLRDAIDQANLSAGPDLINFNAGLGTINVGNMTGLPLPGITDAVTIEGGPSRVELNGASAGFDAVGLRISAPGVILRGMVINNFALSGVLIEADNCTVQRNFIGTDATGASAAPNGEGGVLIEGPNNLIGGTTPTERNVISGNIGFGIELGSAQASDNTIQGNFIGTDANGNPLGNTGDGIRILGAGSNNTIGGGIASAGNTIANNGGTGVSIPAGSGNAVLRNSIFENGGPGINLSDDPGITPNDACDGDAGANGLQNFPVLTSATTGISSTTIVGTLDSTASTTFRIEFFSNPGCDDGSTNGEGRTFIGSITVNTPPSCVTSINTVVPVSLPIGSVVTATATDPLNNTSEFSECLTVTSAGPCTITCPPDFITFTSPNATSCGAVVTFAPETSGACGNATCAPPSGSVFAVGTTTVTCNADGGPSCSFNVIVVDETPPSITCSTGVTAPLPAGQVSTTVTYPAPTATDFCSTTSVVCAPPSGASFPVGSTLVACTARDAFENVSRCFFFVTVVDAEVPVIRCPANTSIPLPAGQTSAVVNYPPPTVTDNFSGASVVCSPASGSSFPAGSTTVTCTATDAVGNKASCSFSVGVGSPQARVSIPGNRTAVEFSANPTRKPPKNNACSFFTIENIGFTPLVLTFDSLKRTGSDVTSGRISDPNDVNGVPEIAPKKFFTLFRVNADQSLTQLRAGEVLTLVQSGQAQLFCLKFAALIPGLTGKSTGLAASDVLPNLVTSTITFRQNAGANIDVPVLARVGTGVVLINPANPRKPPVVTFTRNGNDILVSYAVFDSNLDVTRARYEFLDSGGQVVAGPFEIDLSASISSANLVRGQSFSVEQRFTGGNSNPEVTSVRLTVSDGESSTSAPSTASTSLNSINVQLMSRVKGVTLSLPSVSLR